MAGSMLEALQQANLVTPQMMAEAKQKEENRQLWVRGEQKSLAAKSAKNDEPKKKKSFKPTSGVCPECQTSQAIRPNPEYSEFDEYGYHKLNDPEDHYIMAQHKDSRGEFCQGCGQVPEKLIWERK